MVPIFFRIRRISSPSHCFCLNCSCRPPTLSPHVKQTGRTTGMRLEGGWIRGSRGVNKLGAVSLSTSTCSVRTPRHAPHKPSDARCSSSVDTYQRFPPPSHAWFRATMKASRHCPFPVEPFFRGGGERRTSATQTWYFLHHSIKR